MSKTKMDSRLILTIMICATVFLLSINLFKRFNRPSHVMSIIPSSLIENCFGSAYTNTHNHILRPVPMSHDRKNRNDFLGLIDSSKGFKIKIPTTQTYYQIDLYRCESEVFDKNNMKLIYTAINPGCELNFCFSSDGTSKKVLGVPKGLYWPIIRFCGYIDMDVKKWLHNIYSSVGHINDTSSLINTNNIHETLSQTGLEQKSIVEPANPIVRRYLYEFRSKNERPLLNKEESNTFDRARSIMIYNSSGQIVRNVRIGEIINIVEIVYGKYNIENHIPIEII